MVVKTLFNLQLLNKVVVATGTYDLCPREPLWYSVSLPQTLSQAALTEVVNANYDKAHSVQAHTKST